MTNFLAIIAIIWVFWISNGYYTVKGFVFEPSFSSPVPRQSYVQLYSRKLMTVRKELMLLSAPADENDESLYTASLERPFVNPLEMELITAYETNNTQRFIGMLKTIGMNTKSPLSSVISYFTPEFVGRLSPSEAIGALTGLAYFGMIANTPARKQLCIGLMSRVCLHNNPAVPLETKDALEALTTIGFKISMAPDLKLDNFIIMMRRDMPFYVSDHVCQILHLIDNWKEYPVDFQKSILLKLRALDNKVLTVDQYANLILALGRVQLELVTLEIDSIKVISDLAMNGFSLIKNYDDNVIENQRNLVKLLTGLVGMQQKFGRMEDSMQGNLEAAVAEMYPLLDLQGFHNVVNALAKLDWYWFYGTGEMQRGFEKTLRRHMDAMTPREVDDMLVIAKANFRAKIEFFPGKLQKMITRKMRGLDEEHYDHFGNFKKPKPEIKRTLSEEEVIQHIPEWVRRCLAEGPQTRPPVIDEPPGRNWYAGAMIRNDQKRGTRSTSSKNRQTPQKNV